MCSTKRSLEVSILLLEYIREKRTQILINFIFVFHFDLLVLYFLDFFIHFISGLFGWMFSYFDKNMENFKLFLWNFSLSTGTEIVKSTRRRRGTQSSKIRKKCNSRKCVLLQLLLPQIDNIEMFFSKNIHFFYEPANRILSNNEIDFSKAIFYDFELSLLN